MRSPKAKAAGLAAAFVTIVGAILLIVFLPSFGKSGESASSASTPATATPATPATTTTDFDVDAKTKFEQTMAFDVNSFVVNDYIAKTFGGEFDKDENGDYMIPFSWNSMPNKTRKRTKSAVVKGLRKHRISDAPEFVYDKLSSSDVERALRAEIGDTITVSNIKGLFKEYKLAMIRNPVLFEGFIKLAKGLHYQDSKTFGELNPWVEQFLAKYRKARKSGKGTNYWLMAYRNQKRRPYVTKEYYSYVTYFLAGYIDACEVNVERLRSKVNYHLVPGQKPSQVKMTRCSRQEALPVLTFTFIYKNNVLLKIGSNLCDKRPEILAKAKAKRRVQIIPPRPQPKPQPKPQPQKPRPKKPHKKPIPKKVKKHKKPTPEKVEKKPTPEKVEKKPAPEKRKESEERPEERPKDDKGPGEYEETPKVPKSNSDSVSESQHKPAAATKPPENKQKPADPIPERGSDTGGKEGNKNGEFTMPD